MNISTLINAKVTLISNLCCSSECASFNFGIKYSTLIFNWIFFVDLYNKQLENFMEYDFGQMAALIMLP